MFVVSNILSLKYPKKSHRKKVILPKNSVMLAEFLGIMMGDGGINNQWQITITLNAVADAQYARYIFNLCKKLFGIIPTIRRRNNSRTLVISLTSTSVVDFLVLQGLPRGNKIKNGIKIPEWILKKKSYRVSCLRGLIDTDGCIYIHNHQILGKLYKNIGLSFRNYSPDLIFFVATTLEKLSIMAHITGRSTDVCIYQKESIIKYLKIVSTSNNRIRSVYKKWRDARVV
jgi:hypothetical protein